MYLRARLFLLMLMLLGWFQSSRSGNDSWSDPAHSQSNQINPGLSGNESLTTASLSSGQYEIFLPLIFKDPGTGPRVCPPLVPQTLRSLAQLDHILIGSAVNIRALRSDDQYAQILGQEFSSLTDESTMKFAATEPALDQYNFSAPDAIVAFAESHDMQIRGHTLVWGYALPSWLINGTWTREELIAILQDHIKTVVGHYKGRVYAWDVVNEAFNSDGSLRTDSFWMQRIGPQYISVAFQAAHEADPDALLFVNDFYATPGFVAAIHTYRSLDVPIDGVGLQLHMYNLQQKPTELSADIGRLEAEGLQANITELDVPISRDTGTMEDKLVAQAKIYAMVMDACLQHYNCTNFTMWGFTDKYSWLYSYLGVTYPTEQPLIFTPDYMEKPAEAALKNTLLSAACPKQ